MQIFEHIFRVKQHKETDKKILQTIGEDRTLSVSGLSGQRGLRCSYEAQVHIIDTLVLRMSLRTDMKARTRNEMKNETGNMAWLVALFNKAE